MGAARKTQRYPGWDQDCLHHSSSRNTRLPPRHSAFCVFSQTLFTEARAFEQAIDDEGGDEISDYNPGRPGRTIPQIEGLARAQIKTQNSNREPFGSKRLGPGPARWPNAATDLANQDEWT